MKLTTKEYLSKRRCQLTFSQHIKMEMSKSLNEIDKLSQRVFDHHELEVIKTARRLLECAEFWLHKAVIGIHVDIEQTLNKQAIRQVARSRKGGRNDS